MINCEDLRMQGVTGNNNSIAPSAGIVTSYGSAACLWNVTRVVLVDSVFEGNRCAVA